MNKKIWSLENGEILYHGLHRNTGKKYTADTPFDNKIVPYLVMFCCAFVDVMCFYDLFTKISYHSPWMIGVEILGFIFGFDVIPIFVGIYLRRLRQGLIRERFPLILALAACLLVCSLNIALRITTMDQMTPDASRPSTGEVDITQEEAESNQQDQTYQQDQTSAALTVFGIGIPVVTSVGSLFISYFCYNPLLIRKRREEELIEAARDELRRFEAILSDYDAESDFAERLVEEDAGNFEAMRQLQRAMVISYCQYVREQLKEHLGDPTSNNVLSAEEHCEAILKRLDSELACLEDEPATAVSEGKNTITTVTSANRITA